MKITFEFDTCDENFEMEELTRFNKALDMAKALYEISNKVFYWWENGDKVSTEVVKKEIYEILDDCGIKFDELYK